MQGDALCAIRRSTPPRAMSFNPHTCPTSTAPVQAAGASRCEADRDALGACVVNLGIEGAVSASTPYARRRELLAALTGRSVAIVGDSMARQAFAVLVARLRGADHVLDFNVHHDVRYQLFRSADDRVADALQLPHGSLPQLALSQTNRQMGITDWALARLAGAAPADVSNTTVDYVWAPCSYNIQAAASTVRKRREAYDRIVLFVPAYWHLTESCGHSKRAMLNATSDAIAALWQPWINASRPNTTYTIVNAPVENLRPGWVAKQRALNAALNVSFAAGGVFPAANWELIDWETMMKRAKPATVVPMGDQKGSWHYACQFYRHSSWYLNANHTLNVMTHAAGDCAEGGSTPLWEAMLLAAGGGDAGSKPS